MSPQCRCYLCRIVWSIGFACFPFIFCNYFFWFLFFFFLYFFLSSNIFLYFFNFFSISLFSFLFQPFPCLSFLPSDRFKLSAVHARLFASPQTDTRTVGKCKNLCTHFPSLLMPVPCSQKWRVSSGKNCLALLPSSFQSSNNQPDPISWRRGGRHCLERSPHATGYIYFWKIISRVSGQYKCNRHQKEHLLNPLKRTTTAYKDLIS